MVEQMVRESDIAEADIQEAFRTSRTPADDDLAGWKRRSGEWQAAWAGAYKRAALAEAALADFRSSLAAATAKQPQPDITSQGLTSVRWIPVAQSGGVVFQCQIEGYGERGAGRSGDKAQAFGFALWELAERLGKVLP
jgi:hypothetical protein